MDTWKNIEMYVAYTAKGKVGMEDEQWRNGTKKDEIV